MQNLKLIFGALALACLATAMQAADQPAPGTANATNRFEISGMVCNGCAKGLEAELKLAPGVAAADVSFTNRLAVVACDTNRISTAKLVKVIEESGFAAKLVAP